MKLTVQMLKDKMKESSIWEIVFIKKDGTERKMNASRDWNFLKENAEHLGFTVPTQEATYNADDKGLVRVWDCDNEGWRCICAERVIKIEPIVVPPEE